MYSGIEPAINLGIAYLYDFLRPMISFISFMQGVNDSSMVIVEEYKQAISMLFHSGSKIKSMERYLML